MTGRKDDQEKSPVHLLPGQALVDVAQVYGFGARKYEAHNWRVGMAWSRLIGAALRHILAFGEGEADDPESGLSHLTHAAFCVLTLVDYTRTHPEFDDRWNKAKEVAVPGVPHLDWQTPYVDTEGDVAVLPPCPGGNACICANN